jgi:hypothetical protein
MENMNPNDTNILDMNMVVFWDVIICSLVDADQHFREAY